MSPPRSGPGAAPRGHRWEKFAAMVVAHYGGLCHLCGHGGARQADHVISVADRPDLAWEMSNCRPAHGAPGNPCPVCSPLAGKGVHCNQLRGPMSIERAKRIIAELTGSGPVPDRGTRPEPDTGAGREW